MIGKEDADSLDPAMLRSLTDLSRPEVKLRIPLSVIRSLSILKDFKWLATIDTAPKEESVIGLMFS